MTNHVTTTLSVLTAALVRVASTTAAPEAGEERELVARHRYGCC